MHKRLIKSIFVLFFSLILYFNIFAQNFNNDFSIFLSENKNVFDYANLLEGNEIENLNISIKEIEKKYNANIYIVYTNFDMFTSEYGLIQNDVESFSEKLIQIIKLDYETSEILLFFVDFGTRNFDICAYGDFTNFCFTDYAKKRLQNAFLPELESNEYFEAAYDFLIISNIIYQEGKKSSPVDIDNKSFFNKEYFKIKISSINFAYLKYALILGVVFSLIVAIIICCVFISKMKNSKIAKDARNFIKEDSFELTHSSDRYLYSTKQVREIESNNSSHSGTSINSGGFSHSSGKF